jgi:hypothetical protein
VNNREALNNALMWLFNTHLSSICTKMSENVFARWKGTFPILRMFRAHYHKLIIMATAILHNIAIKFGELEPEDDESVHNLLRAVVCRWTSLTRRTSGRLNLLSSRSGSTFPPLLIPPGGCWASCVGIRCGTTCLAAEQTDHK